MWIAIFLIIALCLFLLPLVPGLREMAHATDAQPLQVVRTYDTDITHFAIKFKAWLEKNFGDFLATQNNPALENAEGTLQDKTAYQIIGKDSSPTFSREEIYNTSTQKLILSAFPLRLTESMLFEGEVYGADVIHTATHSQFRALLAEGDIHLGEGCTVLRWIHSHGSISAGVGCRLFGRASADKLITLSGGCQFERLNAATILFGKKTPAVSQATVSLTPLAGLPNVKDQFQRRWLIDGDLEIPAYCSFDGDIVASHSIRIGLGSRLIGNLKSNQDMVLADGVHIDGTIVSSGDIHIGADCRVTGAVISEKTIWVCAGSIIGTQALPTTMTSLNMHIACGVTAHGTVWADDSASVLSDARVYA